MTPTGRGLFYAIMVAVLAVLLGGFKLEMDLHATLTTRDAQVGDLLASTKAGVAEQRTYIAHEERSLRILTDGVSGLVLHTDHSLNGSNRQVGLLPTATAVIANEDYRLGMLHNTLNSSVRSAQPGIDGFSRAMTAVGSLASDPAIKSTLNHIDATAAQVQAGTTHLNVTADKIEHMATISDAKLDHSLHPSKLSLTWGYIWTVMKIAATHIP